MSWKNDIRACQCGVEFTPKREKQRHCSPRCGTKYRVSKHRSRYMEQMLSPLQEKPLHGLGVPLCASVGGLKPYEWPTPPRGLVEEQRGPTPGALQGSDYPLTYDENGYPELPACLDRRPSKLARAA